MGLEFSGLVVINGETPPTELRRELRRVLECCGPGSAKPGWVAMRLSDAPPCRVRDLSRAASVPFALVTPNGKFTCRIDVGTLVDRSLDQVWFDCVRDALATHLDAWAFRVRFYLGWPEDKEGWTEYPPLE